LKKQAESTTAYETVRLETLVPDSANARKHSERNIEEIMRSLREFGQHAPLVVQKSTNLILVGNGRYEAMRRLGWSEAQAQFVDDDNITAVRRALADNRTAELAEWDDDALASLVKGLGEGIEIPGWNEEELANLLESSMSTGDELAEESENNPLPKGFSYSEQYGVIVICIDEENQKEVYEALSEQGYNCKVVAV
jgi:ParB-like chromosome segregation protein Spo0J